MDGLVGWLLAKEDERQFGIFYDQTIWEKNLETEWSMHIKLPNFIKV